MRRPGKVRDLFIINPAAGAKKNRAAETERRIRELMDSEGEEYEIYFTTGTMDAAEKRALLAKQFGEEKVDALISAFRAAFPEKNELDLLSLSNRLGTMEYCAYHAENARAKTFNYLFAYTFTYDGGKPAWHCSDIPFAFHNTDRVPICWEPGVTGKLEEDVAGSYVSFARYGDPNHPGMDGWAPYTAEKPCTMYWDKESRASDKDVKLQKLHSEVAAPGPF